MQAPFGSAHSRPNLDDIQLIIYKLVLKLRWHALQIIGEAVDYMLM